MILCDDTFQKRPLHKMILRRHLAEQVIDPPMQHFGPHPSENPARHIANIHQAELDIEKQDAQIDVLQKAPANCCSKFSFPCS